jgi:hypothetical protein
MVQDAAGAAQARPDGNTSQPSRQRIYVDVEPPAPPVAAGGAGRGGGVSTPSAEAPPADFSKPYKPPTVNWGSGTPVLFVRGMLAVCRAPLAASDVLPPSILALFRSFYRQQVLSDA